MGAGQMNRNSSVRAIAGRSGVAQIAGLALVAGLLVTAPVAAQEAPEEPTRSANWAVERVSVASDGSNADGDSWSVAVNADGTKMAFSSTASNLGATGGGHGGDVFLKDLSTGAVEHVDVDANGNHLAWSGSSDLDADGRIVTFSSGWGYWSVHGRDVPAKTTRQVGYVQPAVEPALSADGTRIAFRQLDDFYWDSDDRTYAWLHDAVADRSVRVVAPTDPKRYVSRLDLSGDGSTLAYILAGHWDKPQELFVMDVTDLDAPGTAQRIDSPALNRYVQPALSHDGRHLAYGDGRRW